MATGERYAFWPKLQFDRAREAAGLTGGPHVCRHTFASHFLKRQPDLFLLARVMGHSDVTVTRLYTHLLPEHLDRAREAVSFKSPVTLRALKKRAKAKLAAHARRAGRASRSRSAHPTSTPVPEPMPLARRRVAI